MWSTPEKTSRTCADQPVRVGDDADAHACSIKREWSFCARRRAPGSSWRIDRFDEVLVDHAHCEKKAAAQALSMLAAFPSVPGLARAMARLAHEEAGHLGQVLALMEKRGLPLGRDRAIRMRKDCRRWCASRAGAAAGSADRFRADRNPERGAVAPPRRRASRRRAAASSTPASPMRRGVTASCSCASPGGPTVFDARLEELLRAEAVLVRELPSRPAIH